MELSSQRRMTFLLLLLLGMNGITARLNVANASILGEETLVLAKLLMGQLTELERLAEILEVNRKNVDLLAQLNEGIQEAVSQIESLEQVVSRAQGLEPSSIRTLADLNRQLENAKSSANETGLLLSIKLSLAEESIEEAALQSDTSYKMGQEMIRTGTRLSVESKTASPGRAAQISAASHSAQMLAQGVELQTLSHLVQIQAAQLELQKTQLATSQRISDDSSDVFMRELNADRSSKGRQVVTPRKATPTPRFSRGSAPARSMTSLERVHP